METIRVRWHGHSCFEVATDELTVVTDPHDGRSIGILPPRVRADVVLVSHDHFDHSAVRTVEKPGATMILRESDSLVQGPLTVRSVTTYHDRREGESRGVNNAFVFELEGVTFCHLGDLGHALTEQQVAEIGHVDVLFVPVGGVFTIDAEGAWRVIDQIKPNIAVPMHYRTGGLSMSINDLSPFIQKADPDCVINVGNEVEFSPTDLDEEPIVWVFAL